MVTLTLGFKLGLAFGAKEAQRTAPNLVKTYLNTINLEGRFHIAQYDNYSLSE